MISSDPFFLGLPLRYQNTNINNNNNNNNNNDNNNNNKGLRDS